MLSLVERHRLALIRKTKLIAAMRNGEIKTTGAFQHWLKTFFLLPYDMRAGAWYEAIQDIPYPERGYIMEWKQLIKEERKGKR
jgi:hypothetical protein